jgi:hypothetical protein
LSVERVDGSMDPVLVQATPSGLFELAFAVAVLSGAVLLLGGLVSFAVFAYRSLRGEGMRDPRESSAGTAGDDESDLRKGDPDDDWDYY